MWAYLEPVGRGVFSAQRYWGPVTVVSALDIYPGACPNTLNVTWLKQSHHGNGQEKAKAKKGGVLPAALLGSDILDVTFVDASTLLLGGIEPIRSSLEDVASPAAADCDCNGDEPDGVLDLTLKFSRQEVVLALGDVQQGDEITLTLTGRLLDGTPFRAKHCVIIENNERVHPQVEAPGTVALHPAVPNPFNPVTTIRYNLAETGPVSLVVYDVAGRRVATLVDEVRSPVEGGHAVTWNGRNDRGQAVTSGVYFYRLVTRDFTETKKMVLMK